MALLKTPICDLLGIDVPILQAGMGKVAYGRLAAAVANAGGLGSIGGIDITPAEVEEEIRLFRSLSDKPLCLFLPFVYIPGPREPAVVGAAAQPEHRTERVHRPTACIPLNEAVHLPQVCRLKMAKAFFKMSRSVSSSRMRL